MTCQSLIGPGEQGIQSATRELGAGRGAGETVYPAGWRVRTARRSIAGLRFCMGGLVALQLASAADLEWQTAAGSRRAELRVGAGGKAGFTLRSPGETGIRWTNQLSTARVIERQNLMNGSGVAAGDFDGDGRCDLYFCNKEGANALYRNLGDGRFEDVAPAAGVACTNQSSTGAVFADINGDGRLDLLVNSFTGPNGCFLNLGGGRFTNVTASAGLTSRGGTTSLALADVDGDGDLDLYVNYFAIEAILRDGGAYSVRMVNGQPTVTGRYAKRLKIISGKLYEYGDPDVLYLNDGQGRFSAVAWEKGFRDEDGRPMTPPPDFGLAVQMRDINGDGAPDIYVCNDFQTPDRLWLNDGTGQFRAIERLALRNMSYASMGVDFGDLDRDGLPDFLTVEMLSRDHEHHLRQSSPLDPKVRSPGELSNREEVARNALYWNRGDGTYAELGFYSGLAASDWSWTPAFVDVDLDGFEDVLVTNGHLFDVNDRDVAASRGSAVGQSLQNTRNILLRYPRLDSPKVAFRNRGNLTFEEVGAVWGFNSRAISHGMALADLDQDGDLDVVVNCVYGAPLVYRNNSSAPRLAVRLKGKAPNLFGIGARIDVHGGPVGLQTQEMLSGGRYLSGDDTLRVFAAGHATNQLTIRVTWRNGTQSVVSNALPNSVYELDETVARPVPIPPPTPRSPMFEDASRRLVHRHAESAYDDFARQPLLPRKLSQLGPGVAFSDLDGDDRDDLLIANGKGGALAVFRNTAASGFEPWADPAWAQPATDDQTQVLGLSLRRGLTLLLAGVANYEAGSTSGPAALRWAVQGRLVSTGEALPSHPSTVGPMLAADVDGDGSLEVLVGGRLIPGRYPEAAASRLYRLNEQGWTLEAENSRRLEKAGLVSGGVFSDLTGDGLPELILACEWGPLGLWRNDRGQLTLWNPGLKWLDPSAAPAGPPGTLQELSGLWQSVTTGDFDGDGRLDIVAGNWGQNSFYNLAPAGPWFLYHGDLNEDGRGQLLEAYWNPILKQTVPWRDRDLVANVLPWVRERFASHQAYASASVSAILGERFTRAQPLKANTLASTILLNRGDHFEVAPLPAQAQWAPAFGLNAADFDGDGHEDLFLSQNFFAVRSEDDRLDAGRGLLLRGVGDGRGGLTPVAGQDSGIKIYGEQRGAAMADYDQDGRLDVVVAQNGAETQLYRNIGARPGLRVKLESRAPGNFRALGAQMRLIAGDKPGPVREVHGGSGYWSQDSVTQVLATRQGPSRIWVRWPGGQVTTSDIPEGAKEIVVNDAGQVRPPG